MATVNVDIDAVRKQYSSCKQALELMRNTSSKLNRTYAEAGRSWKDERYRQLGGIVSSCCEELDRTAKQIEQCMRGFDQAIAALNEYDSVNLGSSGTREGGMGFGQIMQSIGAAIGGAILGVAASNTSENVMPRFAGLLGTQAGSQTGTFNGHAVTIYNTPHETAQRHAISNQGTAFPTSFRGTCGCCASGTVMNMAGFNFSERDVVSYASNNGLCSTGSVDPADNGGTTAMDRQAIIEGMSGIQCTNTTGLYTLEELATQVETGHGVILGVDASGLPGYNCAPGSGHAIVLASVVRNSSTNEIDGYYIYDSNGRVNDTSGNNYDVCQFVPAETLDMCFESWGRRSNVSLQIIR